MNISCKFRNCRWLLVGAVLLVVGQTLVGVSLSTAQTAIGERILVDTDARYPRAMHAFGKWHVSWLDNATTFYPWLRQYNAAGLVGAEKRARRQQRADHLLDFPR